jgi:hypothetical protein
MKCCSLSLVALLLGAFVAQGQQSRSKPEQKEGLGACKSSLALVKPLKASRGEGGISIYMARGKCGFDACPVYSVSIQGSGAISYQGTSNVQVKGEKRLRITEEKLNAILEKAKQISFFTLCNQYPPNFTDGGSVTISIKTHEGWNHVTDYGSAPKGFEELARLIEENSGIGP